MEAMVIGITNSMKIVMDPLSKLDKIKSIR